ncbi:MAG: hypothetical protein ABR573_02725 [Candidatus Dormibacteria bacterium]
MLGGWGEVLSETRFSDALPIEAADDQSAIGWPYLLVEESIETFEDRPTSLHTAAEIGEQIVRLGSYISRLKLEQARLVGIFDMSGEAVDQGSNSTIDWVRHNAHLSVAEATQLVAVGRQVHRLPASSQALVQGEVGFGHLVQMAHVSAFCAKSKHGDGFDEGVLLASAAIESVSRFQQTCDAYRHIFDQAQATEKEVDAVEARKLTFNKTDDGRYFVNLELDPAGYTTARTALDARSDRYGRADTRNRARRLADGFLDMCMDDMARTARPAESLSPVHIAVSCSCDAFHNQPGAPAAVTQYGTHLSVAALGRLSCDASVTHIKLDDRLLPVGISRLKRQLSKREMRALRELHPQCVRPGCRRPASQCDAHHITWWSRGGKTVIEDMCMVCPFHHWQIHEGGWNVARTEDRRFVWVPPKLARGPSVA